MSTETAFGLGVAWVIAGILCTARGFHRLHAIYGRGTNRMDAEDWATFALLSAAGPISGLAWLAISLAKWRKP